MAQKLKVVIVGAGPVGSLAALYAANRGHDVEIYELRGDLRDPSTIPLNFTKSINLALSVRGITAMRNSGHPKLLDQVMSTTIPLGGRMLHLRRPNGTLHEEAQAYDIRGRVNFAIDRSSLNGRLLDVLEEMPNVKFFFHHKLAGADFRKNKAWFRIQDRKDPSGHHEEVEVSFDFMIGADGAHSAVRYHMMKFSRMDYEQQYIDTLWCEFQIKAKDVGPKDPPSAKFRISPNHLHIWPGRDFMFIAIPCEDGSFTCTLFAPELTYRQLEGDVNTVPSFFDQHFPGVTSLIPAADLIGCFQANPHLPLISIKCKPHHFSSSVVTLGDAAHAMVPFYGQGMNAGLEDVRVLFDILDKYDRRREEEEGALGGSRADALAEYTAVRVPDAHAINDLALSNYWEMRAGVLSPAYRLRKFLEEMISVHMPWTGWQTKYARVSYSIERYSEVVARSEYQGRVLLRVLIGGVGMPLLAGGCFLWLRYRGALEASLKGAAGWLCRTAQGLLKA